MSVSLAVVGDSPTYVLYYPDGVVQYRSWLVCGVWHRAGGPAQVHYFGDGAIHREEWWVNGWRHRLDGPAVSRLWRDGSVELQQWWVGGQELTAAEYVDLADAVNPVAPVGRIEQLVMSGNLAVRRAAILHPACPQELRFLAELEHPDWF